MCSLIYDYLHFWNGISWSPTFFPAAGKECRPRKGAPPRVSGLNFETPAYVRATRSLRSLKHGAAASRRRSQNFPLRGRPPTERAGMLDQYWTYIVHGVRASCSTRTFRTHRSGPTWRSRTCLSFTNDSIFGMRFHGPFIFFPCLTERKRSKRKGSRPVTPA